MLKKKRTRVFVTAVLTCSFVFVLAFGVLAANGTTKSLSAIFRDIKLNVNGTQLQTEEEPFIVNGRTYVPLRVIGEALGAFVDWDTTTSSVNIKTDDASVDARIAAKDAEITKLKAEIEALKNGQESGTAPEGEKSLTDLQGRLFSDFDKLGDAKISDLRLTGKTDYVNVNLDVNLGVYDDEWDDLTDAKIKSWVSALCLDIQEYYSNNYDIDGVIKDTDSKDTLITFSKVGNNPLRISYKDKDYRSGKGMDVEDVSKNLEGEWYLFDDLRFSLRTVNYDTAKDEVRLRFYADDVSLGPWEAADMKEIQAATIEVCQSVANTFKVDATKSPRNVEVKFYDGNRGPLLKTFNYNVSTQTLR